MWWWARWITLWAVLASLSACGTSPEQPVTRWELSIEGQAGTTTVQLPRHLDEYLPREDTRYRLRAEVDPGPLRGQEIDLVVPSFPALVELYVDGQRATPTHTHPAQSYRHAGPHVWHLPASSRRADLLTLELVVDHRWTQSGWLDTVPRLRPAGELGGAGLAVVLVDEAAAIATFSGMVLVGLMSLGVFVLDRSRRSHLWFSIQLLGAAAYPLYVSGYAQLPFGVHDTVLLALCLQLSLFAAIEFSHGEFRGRWATRAWPWGLAVGLAAVVTVLGHDPFWQASTGVVATAVVLAAVTTYQLALGIELVRRPQRPKAAVTFLAEWVVLAGTSSIDMIAWLGLGEPLGGVRAACVGLGVFALLSSLRLAREHIDALLTTDRLNRQLARRVSALETKQREVERLNAQLRDQIGHRSRQLFSMLSLVGTQTGPAPQLQQGELVGRRYQVTRELGAGGMGVVYAVLRQADEQPLALKIAGHADARGLARLAREAEIATRVDHPNVVAITDVDIDPRGFLYMVMEHVDGPSLAEYKLGFGRDRDWALDVLQQVAEGLAALHAVGVVHRDLKPANVLLLERRGRLQAKISDFGISRTLDVDPHAELRPGDSDVYMPVVRAMLPDPAGRRLLDAQLRGEAAERSRVAHPTDTTEAPRDGPHATTPSTPGLDETTRPLRSDEVEALEAWVTGASLTQAGAIVGTPVYMAPELALEPPRITAAADVFSFGVMAYQLLTGERPFAEPPVMAVAEGRALPDDTAIDLRPIPDALRMILGACLRFESAERPTAARLAAVIAELRAGEGEGRETSPRPSPRDPRGVPLELQRASHADAPRRREHDTSPPEPHAA